MNDERTTKNRREVIRSLGRAASIGFLAMVGAIALWRKPAADDCRPYPLCQGCGEINTCSLPQALDARKLPPQEPQHG